MCKGFENQRKNGFSRQKQPSKEFAYIERRRYYFKILKRNKYKNNSSIIGLITLATYNHISTFYFSSLKNMGIQTENWIPHLYHFREHLHSKKIMNGGPHHQYVNLW